MTNKLTAHQRVVLSAALAHEGAAIVPMTMTKGAVTKVTANLISRKLMREIRSKTGMPVWRQDDQGHNVSLVLTRAGRDAIGAEKEASKKQLAKTAAAGSAASTETSIATDRGAHGRPVASDAPRPGSKQALLVEMLSEDRGASVAALIKATSWLPHTIRAAITILRKRGFSIESTRDKIAGSAYRMVRAQPALAGA